MITRIEENNKKHQDYIEQIDLKFEEVKNQRDSDRLVLEREFHSVGPQKR